MKEIMVAGKNDKAERIVKPDKTGQSSSPAIPALADWFTVPLSEVPIIALTFFQPTLDKKRWQKMSPQQQQDWREASERLMGEIDEELKRREG